MFSPFTWLEYCDWNFCDYTCWIYLKYLHFNFWIFLMNSSLRRVWLCWSKRKKPLTFPIAADRYIQSKKLTWIDSWRIDILWYFNSFRFSKHLIEFGFGMKSRTRSLFIWDKAYLIHSLQTTADNTLINNWMKKDFVQQIQCTENKRLNSIMVIPTCQGDLDMKYSINIKDIYCTKVLLMPAA